MVEIKISTVEPSDFSWLEADTALRSSIQTWNSVDACQLPLLIHAGTSDETQGVAPEEIDAFAENTVVPIHSSELWSSKGYSSSLLAITSLTYDRQTGLIVDADIEINDWKHLFSAGPVAIDDRNDLENTLTHELGHFLGLDHSSDSDATMFGQAPDGEDKKRDLLQDDIDGICDLYSEFSVADTTEVDDAGNGTPASESSGSCSQSKPSHSQNWWLYGAWILSLLALRASRRSQASS
jgi:hypothetical protein